MRVLLSGLSVCEHNCTSDQGHIKDGLDLDMDRKVATVLHLFSTTPGQGFMYCETLLLSYCFVSNQVS